MIGPTCGLGAGRTPQPSRAPDPDLRANNNTTIPSPSTCLFLDRGRTARGSAATGNIGHPLTRLLAAATGPVRLLVRDVDAAATGPGAVGSGT